MRAFTQRLLLPTVTHPVEACHVERVAWRAFVCGPVMEGGTMKSMARASFFRVFDSLLGATNPSLRLSSWVHDGVTWERERHSFAGPKHGQTIEIVTLARSGKHAWSVMIVKEYWWVGKESKAAKALRWAKPIEGERSDIMHWFRAQEAALDQQLNVGEVSSAPHQQLRGDHR